MLKKLYLLVGMVILFPQLTTAATVQFDVALDSAFYGNGSPGIGSATAYLNDLTGAFDVTGTFSGLTSNAVNAHLHGLTTNPGTGSAGILLGGFTFSAAPSGTFSRAGGNVGAGNIAGVLAGRSYINIHTVNNGGGEIRGYLLNPTAIPEPGTFVVLSMFAAGAAMRRRRRC